MTRRTVHRAVQHLTKAARANLPAESDDSHSNLGWEGVRRGFTTQPFNGAYVGLSLAPFSLFILDRDGIYSELPLEGRICAEVDAWLDDRLTKLELNKASNIDLPYSLPADVAAMNVYPEGANEDHYLALAAWFDAAHQNLTHLAGASAHLNPGPSPVRCWPHHFDIATYIALESGDAETAKGIGVGLSPGDEGYAEPYFYINPWPHLKPEILPKPAEPGHWHTDGYVGLIATASEFLATKRPSISIRKFLEEGFASALVAQGF